MQNMFKNVILQSAPMAIPFRSFAESLFVSDIFFKELNCSLNDKNCLMSKTVDRILEAQIESANKLSSLKLLELFQPW
jgi:hypothetical protein